MYAYARRTLVGSMDMGERFAEGYDACEKFGSWWLIFFLHKNNVISVLYHYYHNNDHNHNRAWGGYRHDRSQPAVDVRLYDTTEITKQKKKQVLFLM